MLGRLFPKPFSVKVVSKADLQNMERRLTMSQALRQKTEDKPRMDLVPPSLVKAAATIMTFGAVKHGENDWRNKPYAWGAIYSSLQRHMTAWFDGEDKDSEWNKSHLWHAACCLSFLIEYEEKGIGIDNRWKKQKTIVLPEGNINPLKE